MNNDGEYRNSAPCQHCLEIIIKLNIKKIVFSTNENFEIYKPSEYCTHHISHGNRFLNKQNILVS